MLFRGWATEILRRLARSRRFPARLRRRAGLRAEIASKERCESSADHIFRVTANGVDCLRCGIRRPPGNTQNRYPEERRECARRGVWVMQLNDVVFDDLVEDYGSPGAAVEALCADPRPERVEWMAGPRFTTEVAARI